MRRPIAALMVLSIVGFGCGGGTGATTTSQTATTTTVATATTTTAAATTTTTAATTTTDAPAVVFSEADLTAAVLADGDPWVVPIVGTEQFPLTLDDIWPVERFPEERPIYEAAGFKAAWLGAFVEEAAVVITGAHLFTDAAGAAIALDLIDLTLMDAELIAVITLLDPGSLTSVESIESLVGDHSAAVLATGPEFQVIAVTWIQGNLLQFVRIGMAADDDTRQAAAFELAEALAERMAGQ